MKYARNRLIGYGTLICALGVLFSLGVTNVSTFLFSAVGRADNIAVFLVDFALSLLRSVAVPLGVTLIAIGLAIHLVQRDREAEMADAVD